MVDIRITGLHSVDHIAEALTDAGDRIEADGAEAVQRGGARYQERAKFRAPVDTGRLKAGILIDPGGTLDVTVTSHAPYSGFVNFGTSRQSPQEYMGEAEYTTTPEVLDEVRTLGVIDF